MSEPIMVEPAGEHRPAFAAWGLAQDPPLQTATASGWLVPAELYPAVPLELLNGAYVDGFLLAHSAEPEPPHPPPTDYTAEYPRVRRTIGVPDDPATLDAPGPRGEEQPVKAPARRPRRTRKAAGG